MNLVIVFGLSRTGAQCRRRLNSSVNSVSNFFAKGIPGSVTAGQRDDWFVLERETLLTPPRCEAEQTGRSQLPHSQTTQ